MSLYESFIVAGGAGLGGITETLINNWLGPLFIAAVAVFAVMFIKDRAWMKLIGFVGIAAVVGVLIFAGNSFFGEGGTFTGVAEDAGQQVKGGGGVRQ